MKLDMKISLALCLSVVALAGCTSNNSTNDDNGLPCTSCDAGAVDLGQTIADTGESADTATAVDVGTSSDAGADIGAPDVGTDTGTDAGTTRHRGSCVTSADCNNPTWECITIPANDPDGYHTCQPSEAAEPGCATIEAPDNCCLHTDCNQTDPSGTCIVGPIFYCGGVAPLIANICVADECASDADCDTDQLCLPPRVLAEPVARCVDTQCRFDADCVGGGGGECRPFFNPCNGRFTGFSCTYDDSECRSNADCTDGEMRYCLPGAGDGDTSCQAFQPPP